MHRLVVAAVVFAQLQTRPALRAAETAPPPVTPAVVVPDGAKELLGCWKSDSDAGTFIKIEAARVVSSDAGQLGAFAAKVEPGKVTLSSMGSKFTVKAEIKDGKLVWETREGHGQILTRLKEEPEVLKLKALALGVKKPTDEVVKEIQKELAARMDQDQAVRKNKAQQADMGKVDQDNTAYVTKIVREYGWIDVQRFGAQGSEAAFLIVQHSGKLPLMLAALPEIEKDTKAGRLHDGDSFALLYDRTKLMMGEKQRYGSQIGQSGGGEPVVLPLEDRTKVEQYRKEIGMIPLTQYLAMFEQRFGKKIRFLDE